MNVTRTSEVYPISNEQLVKLQRQIRNRGAGREIHSYIHAALNGDANARAFCAGVWEARRLAAEEQDERLAHAARNG